MIMKKKLFIVMVVVVAAMASILCVHRREQVKLMSDVMMANVEALASVEYDSECVEWIDKSCWDQNDFSLVHGNYYYAVCSGSSTVPGGKLECGAVSSYQPSTPWGDKKCLQCIRTRSGKIE